MGSPDVRCEYLETKLIVPVSQASCPQAAIDESSGPQNLRLSYVETMYGTMVRARVRLSKARQSCDSATVTANAACQWIQERSMGQCCHTARPVRNLDKLAPTVATRIRGAPRTLLGPPLCLLDLAPVWVRAAQYGPEREDPSHRAHRNV